LLHADGARLNNSILIRKRMINTWLEVHDSNRSESHLLKVIYVFLLSRVRGSLHMLYGDLLSMMVRKNHVRFERIVVYQFQFTPSMKSRLNHFVKNILVMTCFPYNMWQPISDSWWSHPIKKTPKTSKIKFSPSFCSIE
jgi:hypothetical protein